MYVEGGRGWGGWGRRGEGRTRVDRKVEEEVISIINLHIGLRLENLCLNGRGSLSEFAGKETSIDKFWKQEFDTSTLFQFVRVLQVKDQIERTCDVEFFCIDWLGLLEIPKRVFLSRYYLIVCITPTKGGVLPCVPFWNVVCSCIGSASLLESSRRRSKKIPTVETWIVQEQTNMCILTNICTYTDVWYITQYLLRWLKN